MGYEDLSSSRATAIGGGFWEDKLKGRHNKERSQ
jgi:hypothetical protein